MEINEKTETFDEGASAANEADERTPGRSFVSADELQHVLEEHAKWLETQFEETDRQKGRRADLSGRDLSGRELGEEGKIIAILLKATVRGIGLCQAKLRGAYFEGVAFSSVDFSLADLSGAHLSEAVLRDADLEGAHLTGADLSLADLSHANLKWADLSGAHLRRANLSRATLRGGRLSGAELWYANLSGADLRGAFFEGQLLTEGGPVVDEELEAADLAGACLYDADLRSAKLSGVKGLIAEQVSGANLAWAVPPEHLAEFRDELGHVQEASLNARRIFLGMLLACVYCWLTIATTDESRLLTNSASSPLPIVQSEIPIAWFYWAAFLIIVSVYFYFHIYLYKVWNGLIQLPAIFPDGRSLTAKIYPWLVSGLARSHIRQAREEAEKARLEEPVGFWRSVRLRRRRPTRMPFLENAMSIFLAWWLVPLTLLLFWVRYLPRHDWMGTTFQVVAWVVAALVGFAFYILMVRTLQRMEISFWRTVGTLGRSTALALIALMATSMIWMSRETFSGARVDIAGFRTFADLEEKDVSTRPDNWTGEPEQIPLVKAAQLRSMDLRNARASGAFLVNADLRGANLERAVLVDADLRGAKLSGASLTGADLAGAQLGAADLEDANLDGADLSGADLRGTGLHAVRNLTQAQLDRTCGDGNTKLPEGLRIRRCPTDGWPF